jgi:hypothetical protein
MLFHYRPSRAEPVELPDGAAARAHFEEEVDFHQMLSALGDFPQLLRRLGLIFDLRVPADALPQTPDELSFRKVRVVPSWTSSLPDRQAAGPTRWTADYSPWTVYGYATLNGRDLFAPIPREAEISVGLWTPRDVELVQLDVDGAALKLLNDALDKEPSPELTDKVRLLRWLPGLLDATYAERPGFEGAKYVMSPPLREARHQPFLWSALRSRIINTVATDHAPFDFETQKEMGKPPKSDFTRIPNGIPSVEHRVDLLYTHGVTTGRIDLNTFVDCASTQAARIFGLKGKGNIAVGCDADIVVYDPNYRGTISAKTHHMATDYNAFEGWEIKGRSHVVTVRGRIMAREGKFTGEKGHGKLLKRDCVH